MTDQPIPALPSVPETPQDAWHLMDRIYKKVIEMTPGLPWPTTAFYDFGVPILAEALRAASCASRTPAVCATCQGRRWVTRSEYRHLGQGQGAGGMWNEACPDCAPSEPRTPAPHEERCSKCQATNVLLLAMCGHLDKVTAARGYDGVECVRLRIAALEAQLVAIPPCPHCEIERCKADLGSIIETHAPRSDGTDGR